MKAWQRTFCRGGVPPLSIRGGCTPGNSRLGAVSCAHACTNRWRTCAAMVISQANMPHGRAGQFAGVAPRAIRANGRQATLAPVQEDSARARGLHPRQFAPLGPGPQWGPSRTDRAGRRDARFARAHRATSARARPSAWAVNSRGLHPGQFAPGGGELRSRLYEPLAHVRGGCTPGNSRLGAVSCAHACTNRWRACAPGVSPGRGRRWQKSKKRKGRGKRHWPSLFSLRGIIEEGRTCISRKGAVHFF